MKRLLQTSAAIIVVIIAAAALKAFSGLPADSLEDIQVADALARGA